MSNYQIITDSGCDLNGCDLQELNVICVPLTVLVKGQAHDDFATDAQRKTFYDAIRGGEMPTTSAINPDGWAAAMRPVLEAGQDILTLCFSSGLSTTYQSAVIAAEELREEFPGRKILVVDTLAASLGEGLLVWYACKKRDEGMDLEELYRWVEDNKLHLCHWFTVNDLMHLKRGGRVSAATAIAGTMLNIKPVLHVDNEGHLISVAKCRGRKASIEALAKKLTALGGSYDNSTVFISHGDCAEDVEILVDILKEQGIQNIFIRYVGSVIGAHTGPGVIAFFFLGDHR